MTRIYIQKIECLDKKALTDFSVMGRSQAIDLYVDYVASKVNELVRAFNYLIEAVNELAKQLEKE